jgi:putative ABC transport system permease protein
MLKNYLKIALRNILKYKSHSFINVIGLAVGMVCIIFIVLWIQDELSYDTYHRNAKRIYRVGTQFGPTIDSRGAYTAPPMAAELKNDFPEIEHIARLCFWYPNTLVQYKEKRFFEKRIIWADSSIFNVFTMPFIQGNPRTALTKPGTVVITESMAQKYFDNDDPIGKSIMFDTAQNIYLITGVIEDCPRNSHFQYDFIASMLSHSECFSDSWMGHCYMTYLLLQEGYPPSQLEAKFPDFIIRHYGPLFLQDKGIRYEDYLKKEQNYYGYWLQPLLDIYLNANIKDGLPNKGDRTYIYIFSIIACLILVLACANFINLSTARFSTRYKEIGIRKVIGSNRSQVFKQYLFESIILSTISFMIAILVAEIVLPVFNNFTNKQLEIDLFKDFYTLITFGGLAILVGTIAGWYPALYLSSFNPARILQGKSGKESKGGWLRSGLVVFQFSISIIILISTFIIYYQMKFVTNKNLGFNKEQVLVISRGNALQKHMEVFKHELLANPNILCVSNTTSLPGRHFNPNDHRLEGSPETENYTLYTMSGDYDFAKLLDLEIMAGRYFSSEVASDKNAVVINEAAVKKLGLTNPIGKRFHKEFGGAKKGEFVTIIGVIKDIHFQSLYYPIMPMIIRNLVDNGGWLVSVKIRPENINKTINVVENTWKKFTGDQPFEYSFLDDDINNLYQKEQKTGQIFLTFAMLAISIACLGLFGLASFTSERRTKEIGIRKALGATITNILMLLTNKFVKWVAIANILAWPIAYYAMNKWLQNFAYRIDMSWWMFVLAGAIALTIALLTVSWQAIRAATANPVESLRYE